MYGHRHIDVYKLAHSCRDICVQREKRLKIMTELCFPYLLHSVYCCFLWSTSLLSFSTKLNLSLPPSRALYIFIYMFIWVPISLYALIRTPPFYSATESSVPHMLYPSATLLLKPISMLLSCLEVQLELESKAHPVCRSQQACWGRPIRQEGLRPISPSCLCMHRELSGWFVLAVQTRDT